MKDKGSTAGLLLSLKAPKGPGERKPLPSLDVDARAAPGAE